MGIVITFRGYRPLAREDDVPWTQVAVEEAASRSGPWSGIDTQDLDPIDADPASPQLRNVTTTLGTLDPGWYRLVFLDADANRNETAPLAYPQSRGELPAWLSLDELKNRLDKQRAADDPVLESYLAAAFSQAQVAPPWGTGRVLIPTPEDDVVDPVEKLLRVNGRTIVVPDAREITQVLGRDDVEVADYTTLEHQGAIVQIRLPRERHYGGWCRDDYPSTVKITGRFGYLTVPEYVREAIYTLAARMWAEKGAQLADQVQNADGAPAQIYYRQLPPRVRLAWDSFMVPAAVSGLA